MNKREQAIEERERADTLVYLDRLIEDPYQMWFGAEVVVRATLAINDYLPKELLGSPNERVYQWMMDWPNDRIEILKKALAAVEANK